MCSRSQVLIKKYCIVPINHIFTLSEINELCCKIVLFKFLSINQIAVFIECSSPEERWRREKWVSRGELPF